MQDYTVVAQRAIVSANSDYGAEAANLENNKQGANKV